MSPYPTSASLPWISPLDTGPPAFLVSKVHAGFRYLVENITPHSFKERSKGFANYLFPIRAWLSQDQMRAGDNFPILTWHGLHTARTFDSSSIDPPCERRTIS